MTYLLADSTIKNQLHGNTAGNTDEPSHGGVTTGNTVLAESAGADLLGAVLVLDAELVLEHNQVTLVRAVLHLLLEAGAEGVEGVTAGGDLLVGEDANPAQTGEDTVTLVVVGEGSLGGDGRLEVALRRGSGAEDLLGGFLPADGGAEVVASFIAQEADVNEDLDEFRESLVAEGTTDEGLGLRDVVTLTEGG